jgi:hypothetical protein
LAAQKRTVQRKLDLYQVKHAVKIPKKVLVLRDTNYWGINFGLMLFKGPYSKENLLWYAVKSETNPLYIKEINELKPKCFEIVSILYNGRKGLVGAFKDIPVQLCQFHQVATIRREITKKHKNSSFH